MPPEHLGPFITSLVGALAFLFGVYQWHQGRADAQRRDAVAKSVEVEADEFEVLKETNATLQVVNGLILRENARLRERLDGHGVDSDAYYAHIRWDAKTYKRLLALDPNEPPPPPLFHAG